MGSGEGLATPYRYDGYADWYDAWARADSSGSIAAAEGALRAMVPRGEGLAVDVGCGTGLRRDLVRERGYRVVGLDVSADQVRLARRQGPVLRADGRRLPFAGGTASLVYSVLTHTDLEGFEGLVREGVRLLRPGGSFVYVGVHPCFNSPFAESRPDGILTHSGYGSPGWKDPTAYRPGVVTRRVGVHHLPLQHFLQALVHPEAPLERILETGPGPVPVLLAVRLGKVAR